MLSNEQNDEVSDTTGDTMKNQSWLNKKLIPVKPVQSIKTY